tara:strand:+ start:58 stop:345 length:288 start_codon:yes stop_codon:yes gene_type:complete
LDALGLNPLPNEKLNNVKINIIAKESKVLLLHQADAYLYQVLQNDAKKYLQNSVTYNKIVEPPQKKKDECNLLNQVAGLWRIIALRASLLLFKTE